MEDVGKVSCLTGDEKKEITAENSLIGRINTLALGQKMETAQLGKIDSDENKEIKEKTEQEYPKSGKSSNIEVDGSSQNKENVVIETSNAILEEEQDTLKVVVTQATEYFVDPENIYCFKSGARGLTVIVNNEEFTNEELCPKRIGSQVDVKNLSDLFHQFGFEVIVQTNLKRHETIKFLIELSSNTAHETADMMIFCMATHGPQRSKLMSSDCLEIDTEADILRRFNNENCPSLRGKPKFFIFQACQGQEADHGVPKSSQTDNNNFGKTGAMGPPGSALKDPAWEDMLIAQATLPGFVSYRNHVRGTWFIESLCKVLMTHSWNTSLRDMLDMVARSLKKYQTETGAKQSFKYEVIHFYKKLYFHPGLPPRAAL